MMLLEYFIWGAWYVALSTYMKVNLAASDGQIGLTYGALAIATMISPFFVGMIADRFFAAQRILGLLHIVGGVLLFIATQTNDAGPFYWIILVYSLMYMPTIALTNSIAFRQMTDPGKQFPWIRVFGTLGWIFAGLLIAYLDIGKSPATFHMAAIASIGLGIFSFILPATPPRPAEANASFAAAIGLDALVLFKNRSYSVFFIAAILVCIPLSFYYAFANLFLVEEGVEAATGKMTLGQVSEAVFILAIPFLFNSIGVKKMLLLGMIAWILRYICFAHGNVDDGLWMLYAGIILHGICYDFFFVTGYMYTEQKAGEKIKSAAQGLFTFATYGLGMVIGTWFSGKVGDRYTLTTVNEFTQQNNHDWQNIWYVPAYIAIGVLLYFILFFKEKRPSNTASK
jgi:nucleoside transporter